MDKVFKIKQIIKLHWTFDKILTFPRPKFEKHLGVITELEKEPANNKGKQFLFILLSSYKYIYYQIVYEILNSDQCLSKVFYIRNSLMPSSKTSI